MGEWGFIIILFVGAWLLQIALTFMQNRHYGRTIREMSSSQSPGYLGVGVAKRKIGSGSVVILVSDLSGQVVQVKEMSGVTVFSRFKDTTDLIGQKISRLIESTGKDHRTQAIQMAAERIVEEQNNQKNEPSTQ